MPPETPPEAANSTTRPIEFIYFDLGKVLLDFDHHRASDGIGQLVDADPAEVHRFVFEDGRELQYERGKLSSQQFHAEIQTRFGACDFDQLMFAAANIFEPVAGTAELVSQLKARGHRLGVLSNTCEAHWFYCLRSYADLLEHFELHLLSYEMRTMKPEPAIYMRAVVQAGVEPASIFFVDDRQENVDGACDMGIDAVLFTGAEDLRRALQKRDLLDV